MLTVGSCVRKNNGVPWRIIEEEAILVDVERGNMIQLNEVAAFIWSEIDGRKTLREIIDCVCESFEVDRGRAAKDTGEFLQALLKKHLIRLE